MKKRVLIIVLAIVVVVLVGGFFAVTDGLSEMKDMPLDGVNLSALADGSYTGSFEYKRWASTLVVQVKDHRITGIEMQNDVAAANMTNCSEEVFRRVMEAQSTQVDGVSGATVTSKAYLKAIENALHQ